MIPSFRRLLFCCAGWLVFCAFTNARADDTEKRVDELLGQMTLDEKLGVLAGDKDGFSTMAIPRLNIPKLIMADGPQGVRNYGPACHFPCGAALAATWSSALAEQYGHGLGREARARGVHIMLAPGVNIVRVPVNGRCFEYFGEDPFLASQMAAHYISGVQAEGVAPTIKHYAANNQEDHRMSVDVDVDDRTLHEIYLPTFRRAIEEAHVRAVMSAYNRFRGDYCTHSDFLQNQVLKGELGFPGLLMSDWTACHEPTDLARGLDLEMPHGKFMTVELLKAALERHEIEPARVDDAARRLLRLMVSMGFLDHEQKRADLLLDSPASTQTALEIAREAIVLLKNDGGTLPLDRQTVRRIAIYGPNAALTPGGGGGSGSVTPFHSVSFLDGIRTVAGPGVEVVSVPDEGAAPDGSRPFPMLHTAPDGPPGCLLNATSRFPEAKTALPTQAGPFLQWSAGDLPFDLTGGSADYVFSGSLVPEEDGEWEVIGDERARLTVDGVPDALKPGDVFTVQRGRILHVRVGFYNIRRAAHRDGKTSVSWLSIRQPHLPDLKPAQTADAAVVCVGFRPGLETEGADRPFALPVMQQRMIAAVTAANGHTVVTNNSGAGVEMAPWIGHAAAVLQTWYLGQAGGTALAEMLFGDVNPSGRLPDTFDRTFSENPAAAFYPGKTDDSNKQWPVVHYSEGIFVGYRGYDKARREPLFPFGHGLSYTTFEYGNLRVTKTGDTSAKVSLTVKNTGARAGAEVVQLYVGQPKCAVERPVRELKGFSKIMLQPGEARDVTFDLTRESFAFWHPEKHDWTVDPAPFVIEAGHSSRDLPQRTEFDLGTGIR